MSRIGGYLNRDKEWSLGTVPLKTDGKFRYRRTPGTYLATMALHIIPGLAIGIFVDKLSNYIQKKFNLGPVLMIIIQLVILISILYIIEMKLSWLYAQEWQDITPGIFFTGILIGTQNNLFRNIGRIAKTE